MNVQNPVSLAPLLIDVRGVVRLTGISKTTIYERIKEGRFPKPVFPTPGRAKWIYTDLVEWVHALRERSQKGTEPNVG